MSADLLSAALESAINRYLRFDQDFAQALRPLDGRLLSIDIDGTGVELEVAFGVGAVMVRHRREGDEWAVADVSIRGTPITLVRLAREGAADPTLGGAVRIHGDMEVARDLATALSSLEVDLEEMLSRVTGDATAHQAGRVARGLAAWGKRAQDSLLRDTAEYLTEESGALPGRAEMEAMVTQSDDLRDDVARLEKRIERLLRTRAGPRSS